MTLDALIEIACGCIRQINLAKNAENFADVAKYGEALAQAGADIEAFGNHIVNRCTDEELVAPLKPEIANDI